MKKKRSSSTHQFVKPAHWTNDPPPKPDPVHNSENLSPTRYGDWEKNGLAIDF